MLKKNLFLIISIFAAGVVTTVYIGCAQKNSNSNAGVGGQGEKSLEFLVPAELETNKAAAIQINSIQNSLRTDITADCTIIPAGGIIYDAAAKTILGLQEGIAGIAATCEGQHLQKEVVVYKVVPGRWGVRDTSADLDFLNEDEKFIYDQQEFYWVGSKDIRAQWYKIYASFVDPDNSWSWFYPEHSKGEPPGNTYYLYHFDKPMPEGTKILIEGDFPHSRYMNIGMGMPTNATTYPPPAYWQAVTGDGGGLGEVIFTDVDIVPDPGHINPFLPGADRTATNRHFHVTFELRNGNGADLNNFAGKNGATFPFRAPGNLRYAGTFKFNENSTKTNPQTGQPYGFRGPYIWVRIYMPDGYHKTGQVGTPIIRVQFPNSEQKVLAPPTREVELSERVLVDPYDISENPALGDTEGRSKKELEASDLLIQRGLGSILAAGARPQTPDQAAWTLFNTLQNGIPYAQYFKVFNTGYYTGWLQAFAEWKFGQISDSELASETSDMKAAWKWKYGMGPNEVPPANQENNSGHNMQNNYLNTAVSIGAGQVLVITGILPKTPKTLMGNPVAENEELRYINFTLQGGGKAAGETELRLTPVIDILDEQLVLDKVRRYVIVISDPADRPANATEANGVTWRSWPLGNKLNLSLRVLSTLETPWPYAPHNLRWEQFDYLFGSPAGSGSKIISGLKTTMGPYYPTTKYLTRSQFESQSGYEAGEQLTLPLSQTPSQPQPSHPSSIKIQFQPTSIVASGAKWKLDYGDWFEKSEHFSQEGTHQISFKPVSGFITPHTRIIRTTLQTHVQALYTPVNGNWVPSPATGSSRFANSSVENLLSVGTRLYAIGSFTKINNVNANYIAFWNGANWNALSTGLNKPGEAIASYGSGIVVGGSFTSPHSYISYWNGASWSALGSGMNGPVRVIRTHNNIIYAGGEFTQANGLTVNHIAKWNGSSWEALADGLNGKVYAMTIFGNDLIVTGEFSLAGNLQVNNIARWDGTSWKALGTGLNAPAYALAVYQNELYATGDFTLAGEHNVSYIAKWSGSTWKTLGSGLNGTFKPYGRALTVFNDKLIVGGNFEWVGTNTSARRVASFNGTSWEPLGNGLNNWVEGFAVHQGVLVTCGWFNHLLEGGPSGFASWD